LPGINGYLSESLGNAVALLPPGETGEGVVIKGSGIYLAGQGVQARVDWTTSVTVEWLKEMPA
jgi:hypothetical protein